MRQYNPTTDYPILAAAVGLEGEGVTSLVSIREALTAAGIAWPEGFNTSRTPAALALDRDICRVWGR